VLDPYEIVNAIQAGVRWEPLVTPALVARYHLYHFAQLHPPGGLHLSGGSSKVQGQHSKPMCLAWHTKGQCNANCPCASDHVQYSAPKLAPLATWCVIGYAPPAQAA